MRRFNVHDAPWSPFPEFGGHEAVLYSADDGQVSASSFRLSGTHSWTLPYDDFFYVIAGSAQVTITGGESFSVSAGDFCHLRRGTSVTFAMSDDFHEVSVLVSDQAFDRNQH